METNQTNNQNSDNRPELTNTEDQQTNHGNANPSEQDQETERDDRTSLPDETTPGTNPQEDQGIDKLDSEREV